MRDCICRLRTPASFYPKLQQRQCDMTVILLSYSPGLRVSITFFVSCVAFACPGHKTTATSGVTEQQKPKARSHYNYQRYSPIFNACGHPFRRSLLRPLEAHLGPTPTNYRAWTLGLAFMDPTVTFHIPSEVPHDCCRSMPKPMF